MADLTVKIDAELKLEDTKTRCQFEQKRGFQLDMIKFGTVIQNGITIPINKAEFTSKRSNLILDELTFVDIEGKDPAKVTDEMKVQNRILICESEIYVEKKTTKVMVFGKNV